MTQEDYVSFEVAKLLKEKGFDWKCHAMYDKDGHLAPFNFKLLTKADKRQFIANAPTLQMAMKWLKEVHNIFISINIAYTKGNNKLTYLWIPCVIKQDCIDYPTMEEYVSNSYEDACEAAIKYCLTNLIK